MSTTKKCKSCNQIKNTSDFSKYKNAKDGFQSFCKQCNLQKIKAYWHTKKGLVSKIYNSQRGSSKKRKHPLPTYTKEELKEWLYSQKKFHVLYDNWKRLDFQRAYTPSVDRIDDGLGYTMRNIQLMTWKENQGKYFNDLRLGKATSMVKPQKPILQYTKKNEFISEYPSANEAGRRTKTSQSSITACCKGRYKSAGGFIWRYKKEREVV